MRFTYQAVEHIPKQLRGGVVYHSAEFEVAALMCACGCGHRVMLMVPDGHRVQSEGGMATVRPSVAVCDAPCKSHYVISAGKVEWLHAFSDATAAVVMHEQIARHVAHDLKRRSFGKRALVALAVTYGKLKSIVSRVFGRRPWAS